MKNSKVLLIAIGLLLLFPIIRYIDRGDYKKEEPTTNNLNSTPPPKEDVKVSDTKPPIDTERMKEEEREKGIELAEKSRAFLEDLLSSCRGNNDVSIDRNGYITMNEYRCYIFDTNIGSDRDFTIHVKCDDGESCALIICKNASDEMKETYSLYKERLRNRKMNY